ncbi:MAG TPA: hypothetical protein VIS73_01830 [Rhodocyclaceae bacterium]
MRRHLIAAALSLGMTSAALAEDINDVGSLAQSQFRLFSEDIGATLSYHGQIPAEPLGITGFDIGIAVTSADLPRFSQYLSAFGAGAEDTLYMPTLRVHKGLPFGIDVGLMYAKVPSSNIKYTGGELKWAIIDGNTVLPAVAVRGSLTKLSGVDQLSLDTQGFDVSVSKGLAMFTPYAGLGRVRVTSTPIGVPLAEEKFSQTKVFAGVGLNLALVNLNFEYDKTGEVKSYSAKFGLRF